MKNIVLILLVVPTICFAQNDNCSKIKKSSNEKGDIVYKGQETKNISVIREFGVNPYFALHIHLTDERMHEASGEIRITLSDGTVMNDEQAKIYCRQETSVLATGGTNGSEAHSGSYNLDGFYTVTETNVEQLMRQQIIAIELDHVKRKVRGKDAEHIAADIGCLNKVTP
jgi:hypothetical protein